MGWFWSTSGAKPEPAPAATAQAAQDAAVSSASPATSVVSPSPSSASSSSAPDAEVSKFLSLFEESPSSKPTPTPAAPPRPSPSSSSWLPFSKWASSSSPTPPPPAITPTRERSLAEATLPTDMSCRQAFDLAWACQSPGGQWRAVYRHGTMQSCSQLWDDFWFCMRVKGYSGTLREDAIREHYRQHELAKYYAPGRPSSEDVWRSRTLDEVLPAGAVFQHDFQVTSDSAKADADVDSKAAKDAVADAEQIRSDMDRRRRIRQDLGYEK